MNLTKRLIDGVVILSLLLLVLPRSVRATSGWLPVSPDDLAMKDNPKQPGADAMILYRENVVDASKTFSDGDSVEEYVRIKIFTQEGTKWGHVEIPFVKGSENVSYTAGRTIRPDGSIEKFDGQVLETTIEKTSGYKVLVKTFTLPDVQPGCIIEFKYQLQGIPNYVHDRSWSVSREIFTREAQFTYVPYTGYGGLGLTPRYRPHLLPQDAAMKQQINGSYTMVVRDIPGVEEETLMPPEGAIEARVEFYYDKPDAPSEDDAPEKFWNHYAKKWNGELEHFIDKKNVLDAEVSKIVSPGDPPETKLRKIYARVQQVRNLNVEDYKTQKETKDENLKPANNVEDVLSRGYANGRQVNYLFVGLARAAGLDATEVYIQPRTTDLYFAPNLKEARVVDDDIVWARAGSQEYYLDPGARYFPFGLLPWYETDAGGIRITKGGGEVVTTSHAKAADATLVRTADLTVKQDGSISGTLQVDFAGQEGALLREGKRKEDEAGRTKDLEDRIKGWLPVGSTFEITKIADWDDNGKPVHVEGTLQYPSFAGIAMQRMLMPRDIFQVTQASWFATARRVNNVYFRYPFQEIDDLKLHAPAGYKADSLATVPKVDLGAASYETSATPLSDGVEVKRNLSVNGIFFSKDSYPTLRAFFGTVKTEDDARMVLQHAP